MRSSGRESIQGRCILYSIVFGEFPSSRHLSTHGFPIIVKIIAFAFESPRFQLKTGL